MWNDDGNLSVRARKILIYFTSLSAIIILFIAAYFLVPKGTNNTEFYISVVAVVLTIVGFILSITNDLVSQQMNTKLSLSLDVYAENNHARITCSIENKGKLRIDPVAFYIFIDQPTLCADVGIYQINHILKHDCKKNCRVSEMCRTQEICEYPGELRRPNQNDSYYAVKKLDFLAPDSMLYVNPGECFSEDVIIKLHKGVYRVLLIGTFNKSGCLCANKQFIIE